MATASSTSAPAFFTGAIPRHLWEWAQGFLDGDKTPHRELVDGCDTPMDRGLALTAALHEAAHGPRGPCAA
eukprot:6487273-Pyramimonas_sp.AAC.1